MYVSVSVRKEPNPHERPHIFCHFFFQMPADFTPKHQLMIHDTQCNNTVHCSTCGRPDDNDNDNSIDRRNSRIVSNAYAQVARAHSCANHVRYI